MCVKGIRGKLGAKIFAPTDSFIIFSQLVDINKLCGLSEHLLKADKSAVGGINRPLRMAGLFVNLHVLLASQPLQQHIALLRGDAPLGDHAQDGLALLFEVRGWTFCRTYRFTAASLLALR